MLKMFSVRRGVLIKLLLCWNTFNDAEVYTVPVLYIVSYFEHSKSGNVAS